MTGEKRDAALATKLISYKMLAASLLFVDEGVPVLFDRSKFETDAAAAHVDFYADEKAAIAGEPSRARRSKRRLRQIERIEKL